MIERILARPVDEVERPLTALRVAQPHRPVARRLAVSVVKAQVAAGLDQSANHRSVADQARRVHRRAAVPASPVQ